jgi:ATP-dependent Lon protease
LKVNGLLPEEVSFSDDALRVIIRDFTREAGVRELERGIGKVCRKIATLIAEGSVEEGEAVEVDDERVRDMMGKPRYRFEAALRTEKPGVATGLAWTPRGGEVLFVEAATMPGADDKLILTGSLGDVMRESARIALSYVESHFGALGLCEDDCKGKIHLHVPSGAVPKDGPSAGVTMVTALVSLLSGRPVDSEVGMTGEVTLQGQVLPIGGLKLKVLAAHRAELKKIILPKLNEIDLDDIPEKVREEMEFVLAEDMNDVLEHALVSPDKVEESDDEVVEPTSEPEPTPVAV